MLLFISVQQSSIGIAATGPLNNARLAVLVEGEATSKESADLLEPLLEAEMSRNWSGTLVERKEIDAVLKELALGNGSSAAGKLQLGKVLHTDYLVLVRVMGRSTTLTIDKFPSTTVLHEAKFDNRQDEAALAKRIVIAAIRAIEQDKLDDNVLYVSIGAFVYSDPFQLYALFDESIHGRLRERLAKRKGLAITERRFVSQLLQEYQLARSGITRPLLASLSAPPSDILIVGEFRPAPAQPLQKREPELEFVVRLLAPTQPGLRRELQFKAKAGDATRVVAMIESAVHSFSEEVRAARHSVPREETNAERLERLKKEAYALKMGGRAEPGIDEFTMLKRQAIALLPDQSYFDGLNYYGGGGPTQRGAQQKLARALTCIENAMLYKSDDPHLLCAAASVLAANIEPYAGPTVFQQLPSEERERVVDIANAALDFLETAYALHNDNTTRSCYFGAMHRFRAMIPERARAIASHIVKVGTAAGFDEVQVRGATFHLFQHSQTFDEQVQQFRALAKQAAAGSLSSVDTMFYLLQSIEEGLFFPPKGEPAVGKAVAFADELLASTSPLEQCFGHMLRGDIYFRTEKRSARCLQHYQQVFGFLPKLGPAGLWIGRSRIVEHYDEALEANKLPKSDAWQNSYALVKHGMAQNDFDYGYYLYPAFDRILPELDKRGEFAEGHRLVSAVLTHVPRSATQFVEWRSMLGRWKNHFEDKLSHPPRLSVGELARVEFVEPLVMPRGAPADRVAVRVRDMQYAAGKIWVVVRADDGWRVLSGRAYSFAPDKSAAEPVQSVSGIVTALAASPEHTAVATQDAGLWLLDQVTKHSQHFTPENSLLPSLRVVGVCAQGANFILAFEDPKLAWRAYLINPGKNFVYEFERTTGPDSRGRRDFALTQGDRLKPGPHSKTPAIRDTIVSRSRGVGSERLVYQGVQRQLQPEAPVRVTDAKGDTLFELRTIDLAYLNDFIQWRGHLLFATSNGLYASRVGTNRLACILSDVPLEMYSLCAVGERLFIGTNQGLYRIDAQTFEKTMAEIAK